MGRSQASGRLERVVEVAILDELLQRLRLLVDERPVARLNTLALMLPTEPVIDALDVADLDAAHAREVAVDAEGPVGFAARRITHSHVTLATVMKSNLSRQKAVSDERIV